MPEHRVNPLLDGTKYLPHSVSPSNYGYYEDPPEVELYDRMLRETDFARQRDLMRQFEKRVLDTEAHEIFLLWRYRIPLLVYWGTLSIFHC